jgi:PBP1b-binding outer membrane lipoprotein LpoB
MIRPILIILAVLLTSCQTPSSDSASTIEPATPQTPAPIATPEPTAAPAPIDYHCNELQKSNENYASIRQICINQGKLAAD